MIAIKILRWTGRITSQILALLLLLIAFYIGRGGKGTSATDLIGLMCFVLLIIGLILSWPWEKLGIIMSYAGFAGVLIMMLAMHEHDIMNIWYMALPTTLLAIARLLETKTKSNSR